MSFSIIGVLVVAITTVILIGLILSLPVMFLWNWCLVPAVTGLNEIGWMQAWGIMILMGLLFKTSVDSGK